MKRSATLPPIRVTAETEARLEATPGAGESLTRSIESAVCREAEFFAAQNAALVRAMNALDSAEMGEGLMTTADFLKGMEQRASAARSRIRRAVAKQRGKRPQSPR